MSKVTYLWGAGASFGSRRPKDHYKSEDYIVRGVPVISEFSEAINDLIKKVTERINKPKGYDQSDYMQLSRYLKALRDICIDYPTVDTYARLLAVTGSQRDYSPIINYDDLKLALSLFLTMEQLEKKRDPRYDGFISSIISDQGELPPTTILSWNYDLQFEQAFAGYSLAYGKGRYIPRQWRYLNVLNKTYDTPHNAKAPFSIIKLNGTATFSTGKELELDGCQTEQMADCFFGREKKEDSVEYAIEVMKSDYHNHLSYVWEKDNLDNLLACAKKRINDTKEFIVIGYSFPYVNRVIDEEILRSMPSLTKIWIQDPNIEEIEERVKSMLPDHLITSVKIEHVKNTSQFRLPISFE